MNNIKMYVLQVVNSLIKDLFREFINKQHSVQAERAVAPEKQSQEILRRRDPEDFYPLYFS